MAFENLHPDAKGLRLYRHDARDDLIACELVLFDKGRPAVEMTLRRAALAGRVEVDPPSGSPSMDYFADVYTDEDSSVQTIGLDRHSYCRLKNHWMRCRVERTT